MLQDGPRIEECSFRFWRYLLTFLTSNHQSLKTFSLCQIGGFGDGDKALTAALRDLYKTMDKGQTIPPVILVQLLHNVFPRFAERAEQGGFQQQDANECWVELMGVLKRHLKTSSTNSKSAVDTFFGLEFDTETKCVESEDEPVTKSKEHFLQYNCYIDKDVKYLASGLKNVSRW